MASITSLKNHATPTTGVSAVARPRHAEGVAFRVGARRPPPLENGDHLDRAEFERRYEARPEVKKAELIEGLVYMPSPVRAAEHSEPAVAIVCWLGTYASATPGVSAGDSGSVRLDERNEFQPDACLRIAPQAGGQAKVDPDGYLSGAPELVVEVAASTASRDLHEKLAVYCRCGVREYVVWRVLDGIVDWFVLKHGRFEKVAADAAGIQRSATFPGLWLDTAALLRGNLAKVLRVVRRGTASREHRAFVARLRGK